MNAPNGYAERAYFGEIPPLRTDHDAWADYAAERRQEQFEALLPVYRAAFDACDGDAEAKHNAGFVAVLPGKPDWALDEMIFEAVEASR